MKSRDISGILDNLRWAASHFSDGVGATDEQDEDGREVVAILADFQILTNRIVRFCAKEEVTL
jgi:hypothetical protein